MAEKKEPEKKTAKANADAGTKKTVVAKKTEHTVKQAADKKEVVKVAEASKQKEDAGKKTQQKKEKKPGHKKNVDGKSKTPEMKKAEKTRKKIRKKTHPVFRGRFGKKQFRRKSNKKWQKWRLPRGIDIFFRKEDGSMPRIGYRVPKEFRHFHPSGMREVMVANPSELSKVGKDVVVRISGTVGKRKRKEIIKKAKEAGVKVLN
jgi:large subunit ribosomal protein L32e